MPPRTCQLNPLPAMICAMEALLPVVALGIVLVQTLLAPTDRTNRRSPIPAAYWPSTRPANSEITPVVRTLFAWVIVNSVMPAVVKPTMSPAFGLAVASPRNTALSTASTTAPRRSRVIASSRPGSRMASSTLNIVWTAWRFGFNSVTPTVYAALVAA